MSTDHTDDDTVSKADLRAALRAYPTADDQAIADLIDAAVRAVREAREDMGLPPGYDDEPEARAAGGPDDEPSGVVLEDFSSPGPTGPEYPYVLVDYGTVDVGDMEHTFLKSTTVTDLREWC